MDEIKSTDIYRQFEMGTAFKNNINLSKDIARATLFENGVQWVTDEDLDEYSKITLNIIKQIGETYKSNILQNEYSYLITSTNFKDVRKIQDFLQHLSITMNLRAKDLKALNDDYCKGTAIMLFYWDEDRRSYLGKVRGRLRSAIIDIRRLVVADPYPNGDYIQDQEWIIYNTEVKIKTLKKKYGAEKCLHVVPDGKLYTIDTEDIVPTADYDDERVNIYIKFYRNNDGEVLYSVATQTALLVSGQPMNPFYTAKDKGVREETTIIPDKQIKDKRSDYIWDLYPFARLSLNERDNCFYGSPIALEYVEAQKSINNHFAIYDKALQDNVLGGFVMRKGLFGSQEITTDNGQMLEAENLMPGENLSNLFMRFPSANVPADSARYSQALIDATRAIAGATNVQLGMSDYSGQSGKQTELLLQRARENSSVKAMLFNEFKREQAYIMFLFAKFYYENENFVIVEHGAEEDVVRAYTGDNSFDGTKYLEDDVIIDIRVGAAQSFSEYTNLEIMGLAVQSGQVPFEAYIRMLPQGFISNQQELLKVVKKYNAEKQKMASLEQQVKQLEQVIQQMVKAYEQTEKDRSNIDTIINENNRLKQMMADIAAKAVEEVSENKEQVQQMTSEMQKMLGILNKKQ